MCPSHSNNSPNLVMGSGPLTRDNCQSPEYGLVNRSSGHGGSGIPLVGETVRYGQLFWGESIRRDAWKVRRMPNSSSMESSMLQPSVHPLVVGGPQLSGHQTLASGGVAQATGVRLKSHFLAANSLASSSSTKDLVVIAFFTSASFDWLSVKPLSATLEVCLSSKSGIQSFTAIRVARSSSAAITLLGIWRMPKGPTTYRLPARTTAPGSQGRSPGMPGHLRP